MCSSCHYKKDRVAQSVYRLSYGMDNHGITVQFPTREREFSLSHSIRTGFGAHPASYPVDTVTYFSTGKTAGA
jgi:hypothetical protein